MRVLATYFSVLCLSLSIVVPHASAKKKQQLAYGEVIALSSANLINRHKTVGSFVRTFKPHMKSGEYRKFKKTLRLNNISWAEKMPRAKAVGNKILISQGGEIRIKNSAKFSINGKVFGRSRADISKRFEKIYSRISNKTSKVSVLDILFPKAHAFGDAMGIVAIIGSGLAGHYLGPKLGVKKSTGAILGVGGIYLATELWQSFKSGDITCTDDGRYQRRSKERNMWFMAMSEQNIIPDEKVEEAGLDEVCTKANAASLQAWASGSRLDTPVQDVEPVAPSTAIYGE